MHGGQFRVCTKFQCFLIICTSEWGFEGQIYREKLTDFVVQSLFFAFQCFWSKATYCWVACINLLHVFKWKRCTWYIVYSTLNPSTTCVCLIAATYHLSFSIVPLWLVSTIFLLCFCRHWYFTSLGATAWPRRFSEMLCRWTPRPMRCGTAWVRCCRLKAMMMLLLSASWRHWSLKPAVLLSLLQSSREFFERIPWPAYFGLTSGCENPVFQAAW